MNEVEARILINNEIRKTRRERSVERLQTATFGIAGGIITSGGGLLFSFPIFLEEENIGLSILTVLFSTGSLAGIITDLLLYSDSYDSTTRLKLLKEIRKELKRGNNIFQDTEVCDFDEKLKQYK